MSKSNFLIRFHYTLVGVTFLALFIYSHSLITKSIITTSSIKCAYRTILTLSFILHILIILFLLKQMLPVNNSSVYYSGPNNNPIFHGYNYNI